MATVRWIGNAQNVPQVTTITVADTWASGDTFSLICNDKTLTMTCGSTMDTTAEVAAGIAEMVMSASHEDDDLTADMSINAGGLEYGEFYDMEATVSGSVVTLKSSTAGVPFTVTKSETTAGDGSTTLTTTQAATGKHFFDNGDNWEGGGVPGTGDTPLFENSSVACLYALDNTTVFANFIRRSSYDADIGLPVMNRTTSAKPYREYRKRRLDLPRDVGTAGGTITIGEQDDATAPSGNTRIDLGAITPTSGTTVKVLDAPAWNEQDGYGVEIIGGINLIPRVVSGSVSFGEDQSGNQSDLINLYVGTREGDEQPVVLIGENTTSASANLFYQYGGTVYQNAEIEDVEILGGTWYQAGNITTTVTIHNGATVKHRDGSWGAITVYGGGTFDFRESTLDYSTSSPIVLYKGARWLDPERRCTDLDGFDFVACSPHECDWVVQANRTWTSSAIA